MLTFKLITVVVIFIIFFVLSLIFRTIAEVFEESENLESKIFVYLERKMNKFKTFLKKIRGEPSNNIVLQKIIPLRSIFRTYAIESVI